MRTLMAAADLTCRGERERTWVKAGEGQGGGGAWGVMLSGGVMRTNFATAELTPAGWGQKVYC
jgi:hypothetical protein